MSLPSRERGLKLFNGLPAETKIKVAPLAGAWIEIHMDEVENDDWIVAPLAGAWIEMDIKRKIAREVPSRSPRGSVD